MKLQRARVHEVVVPCPAGRVHSSVYSGGVFAEKPKFIVEAQTDTGVVGLGETKIGVSRATLESQLRMLASRDLERMCFQEPRLVDSTSELMSQMTGPLEHRLVEFNFNRYENQYGAHVLLLDLIGKHANLPVHALLGGAYRLQVRVDGWMGRMTPEESARRAAELKAQGYMGVKCKCDLSDDNVGRAKAVLDACGPQFKMTFDPNCRFYRPAEAMPTLRALAELGNIGCLEDPYNVDRLSWFRQLRDLGLVPVGLTCSFDAHLIDAIRMEAADYVNIKGTPWDVKRAGDACWAAGLACWCGSGGDLGIIEALVLHVAAATKSATRPSEAFGRSIREHNLITNPFTPVDGLVDVPTGPGLGVELDRDALAAYTVATFELDLR